MTIFRRLVAPAVALSLLLAAPAALRAQGNETPVTFDRAGMIPVISRGYAERLGLRPPGWRVQGDYREVRAYKGDGDQYVLVIQRDAATPERLPVSAEQFESLRLEVETRVSVLTGDAAPPQVVAARTPPADPLPPPGTGPAVPLATAATAAATTSASAASQAPATPAAGAPRSAPAGVGAPAAPSGSYAYRAQDKSAPAGADYARNQLILGATLYGPLVAGLVEDGATATAAYIATVAATYFAVAKPAREGKFTTAQNRLATGMAVGGAASGAALAYMLGLGDATKPIVKDKGMLGFALAGAFAGAFSGTVLARDMTDAEAEGINFGGGAGLLFASGILAATKGESAKGDARLIGGLSLAGLVTGGIIGHAYVSQVPYTVTTGDLTGLASPALIGMMAGLTIARPTASSSVTAAATLTTLGMAAGLAAGDWFFVRRWDMTAEQGWMLNLGTIGGAAVMTAPFFLGNQRDAGVLFGAATVGGLLGAWGVTQLSNFAPGTMKARPAFNGTRGADAGPVSFDVGGALMAASGMPGSHGILRIRF